MPSIRFNACAIAVSLLVAMPLAAQVAVGNQHFQNRAAGATGAQAKAGPIDAAIAAYSRAVAQNPNDIDAHARLLASYRFKGAHVASTNDEKKAVYGIAKAAGDKALEAVARALAAKGVKADAPENAIAAAARAIPGAAEVYLWDAVNWGEWALAYGKLAAARQGAADRIRRGATIAHIANPRLDGGAPGRVLGRLHDQTPRIPFITGWASSKEAVRFLEEARRYDPANKLTLVFLAEALVSNDAAAKPRAIQLLREAVATPPNPEMLAEDAQAIADAKALLKKWGA